MCQLTFADLGNLNRLYLTNQLIFNALDNNPDGVGVATEGTVWKSKLDASLITNLGECLNSIISDKPVLGHVRLASNKTLNKVEHSHPFKGELLTQIHNGKLEPDNYGLIDRSKVDSEIFLEYLEDLWKANDSMSFPDVLTKAMEDWKGKFALMYHVGVEDEYYIVRGKQADLYYTYVNGKLVVNTEEDCLVMGLRIFDQLHQVLHKKALNIDKVKELPEETIFKFDRENSKLEKVGEIKEEPIPSYTTWTTGRGTTVREATYSALPLEQEFEQALFSVQLSIEEADYLATLTEGKSLIEMTRQEIQDFIDTYLELLADHVNPKMALLYTQLKKQGLATKAYSEGLEFPWMFNGYDDLVNIMDAIGAKADDTDT